MPKYIDADRFKRFLEGEEDGVWCDEICDDCLYEVEYRIDHFPAADVEPKQRWTPVEEGLPQERDTIFARFYGTEKWKPGMIRRVSDDVRVVAVFDDGTAMVWHDHTVDGVWSCEKYEINLQRKITHWMENPELPKEQEEMK